MAGNLRAWFEMIPKRVSKVAHPEIREVVGKVAELLLGRHPWMG
jgi:thymidylate synthase ThyX